MNNDLNKVVVGVADMAVSDDPDDMIITFALGSCLGLVIYDPVAKVGGILHAMLPDSSIHREKDGAINPYKFVDTGIPMLFKEAYKLGAQKKKIEVKMTGCSQLMDDNGFFNIGKRNYAAARKILWRNNVLIDAEFCDNARSVTLMLEIKTGKISMKVQNKIIPF
jgi:chemotaxis protein CheD